MKAQVSEMALDLFLENGYEQTTIDDICAVASISRSTFSASGRIPETPKAFPSHARS